MNISFVTIHVSDLEKSIHFYEDVLGMKTVRRFPAGPGTEIAFLGETGAQLELICDKNGGALSHGNDISIGLPVPSLDACMEELKAKGVPIHSGPIEPNPHTRFIFILDPDGVNLELIEEKE